MDGLCMSSWTGANENFHIFYIFYMDGPCRSSWTVHELMHELNGQEPIFYILYNNCIYCISYNKYIVLMVKYMSFY
jgi:hypothetical protein